MKISTAIMWTAIVGVAIGGVKAYQVGQDLGQPSPKIEAIQPSPTPAVPMEPPSTDSVQDDSEIPTDALIFSLTIGALLLGVITLIE